jgi:hypothetical protein
MDFLCNVTPHGPYIEIRSASPDPGYYYVYRVYSKGWGYTDTVFAKKLSLPYKYNISDDLVIMHHSANTRYPVLCQEKDFVLASPNGQIKPF